MTIAPEEDIAVAIVGAGSIAAYHVGGLRAAGGTTVAALVGRDPARTGARAAALGIPRAETRLEAVLDDPAIDAVVIATPDVTHEPFAIAAMEAGKAVLLQKPMAMTSAQCRSVLAAQARTGARLTVSFMHRYFPEVSWLRGELASGRLGEVHSIRQRNATPGADWNEWFFSPQSVAGGVVMQLGVHGIDLLQHVFGPIVSVQAAMRTARPFRQLTDGRTVESTLEDNVAATYGLQSGAMASHEMCYTERAGCDRFRLEVYTEAGTIWLRTERGPAALYAPALTGKEEWVVPAIEDEPLGAAHHRHWLAVVRGEAPADGTAEAGLSAQRIAEHVYEAAATRVTLDVAPEPELALP